MCRASSRLASLSASSLCVDASAQCIHEVDDFRRRPLPRYLNFLTGLLLLQQLLQRIFVVVLKFFGLEVAGLGFDDVRRQLQHVLRNFLILDAPRRITYGLDSSPGRAGEQIGNPIGFAPWLLLR